MEPYAHLGRLKGRMTRLTNKILNETDPTIDYTDEKTLYDQSYNVVQEILAEDVEYVVEESEPETEANGTPSDAAAGIGKGLNSEEASEHPSEQFYPLRCFHCAKVLCERVSNSDMYGFGPDGMPVIRATLPSQSPESVRGTPAVPFLQSRCMIGVSQKLSSFLLVAVFLCWPSAFDKSN